MSTRYWSIKSTHPDRKPTTLISPVPNTDLLVSVSQNDEKLTLHELYNGDDTPTTITPTTTSTTTSTTPTSPINALDTYLFTAYTGSEDIIFQIDLETGKTTQEWYNTRKKKNIHDDNARDRVGNRVGLIKTMNEHAIATTNGNRMTVYDVRAQDPVISLTFGDYPFSNLDYCGDFICMSNADGNVFSVDLRNDKLYSDKISQYGIMSMSCYAGGTGLTLDGFGNVEMHRLENEKVMLRYNINDGREKKLLSNPVNLVYVDEYKKIIHGNDRGGVQVWSVDVDPLNEDLVYDASRYFVYRTDGYEAKTAAPINITKYDPWAKRLIACSNDGKIHIWDDMWFQNK